METASVNSVEETSAPGLGPGNRLQAARIQLGMSIGDVANQMHLSTAILEALEENNFDEITAPIFVKGYLRAYARIVSIDEDAIINEYGELYSNEDPPITTTSNTASEISSSDARVKWMTYLVIIVLIALLGAWWWSQEQTSQQVISLDAEESTLPVPVDTAQPGEADQQPVEADQQPVDDASDDATPAAEEPIIESDAAVGEEELPLMSLTPEPETSTEPVEETDSSLPAQLGAASTGEAVDTPAPAAPTATVSTANEALQRQAPEGSDQFRLVVNADTWADIKDATGFQLIYDLMRADTTLEMTGTAPFVVFLGNGHGVDVEINGERLDITSFIRDDNTARFQTGG